jgi:hypothetical protein
MVVLTVTTGLQVLKHVKDSGTFMKSEAGKDTGRFRHRREAEMLGN